MGPKLQNLGGRTVLDRRKEKQQKIEKIRKEVEDNIRTGAYGLKIDQTLKGPVWKVFAAVTKEDGSVLHKWVCCTECKKLYYDKSEDVLKRHDCLQAAMPEEDADVNGEEECDALEEEQHDLSEDEQSNELEAAASTEPLLIETESRPSCNTAFREAFEEKLKNGHYKLVDRTLGRSPLWSLFAKIANENGTIFDDRVYCRQCKNVLKYNGVSTANFYRHRCYLLMRRKKHAKTLRTDRESQDEELSETSMETESTPLFEVDIRDEVRAKLLSGVYKLMDKPIGKRPIWSIFTQISKEDGTALEDWVCCRQCRSIFKYNGCNTSNFYHHKCYVKMQKRVAQKRPRADHESEDERLSEASTEHESSARPEIAFRQQLKRKLESGQYTLVDKSRSKSVIWSLYAKIATEDGSVLVEWVYCRECKNVFKYNDSSRANFYRHKCYINMKTTPPKSKKTDHENDDVENQDTSGSSAAETELDIVQRNVESKVQSGIYKLTNNPEASGSIWSTFNLILKDDGATLPEFVCCRQCHMVLHYDGKTVANLKWHKCCITSPLPTHIVIDDDETSLPARDLDTCSLDTCSTLDESQIPLINAVEEETDDPYSICVKEEFAENESTPTFEIPIREEVETKLKSGDYKLIEQTKNRSPIWALYAKISKEDGKVLCGWVYCRECKNVLKFNGRSTANFYRHKCYMKKQPTKGPNLEQVKENENAVITKERSTEEMDFNRQITENDIQNATSSSIWSVFNLILSEDGSILDGLVCCRQCNVVLKYDGQTVDNLQLHKCSATAAAPTPTPIEINDDHALDESQIEVINVVEQETDDPYAICVKEEFVPNGGSPCFEIDIRSEIKAKLKSAHYKLIEQTKKKSPIWSLYAQISKEDGSVLSDWLYCRECTNVLKFNGKCTANFYHHKCYSKIKNILPAKGANVKEQGNGQENVVIAEERGREKEAESQDTFTPITVKEEYFADMPDGPLKIKTEAAPMQLTIYGNSTNGHATVYTVGDSQITIKTEVETDDPFADDLQEEFISINSAFETDS